MLWCVAQHGIVFFYWSRSGGLHGLHWANENYTEQVRRCKGVDDTDLDCEELKGGAPRPSEDGRGIRPPLLNINTSPGPDALSWPWRARAQTIGASGPLEEVRSLAFDSSGDTIFAVGDAVYALDPHTGAMRPHGCIRTPVSLRAAIWEPDLILTPPSLQARADSEALSDASKSTEPGLGRSASSVSSTGTGNASRPRAF